MLAKHTPCVVCTTPTGSDSYSPSHQSRDLAPPDHRFHKRSCRWPAARPGYLISSLGWSLKGNIRCPPPVWKEASSSRIAHSIRYERAVWSHVPMHINMLDKCHVGVSVGKTRAATPYPAFRPPTALWGLGVSTPASPRTRAAWRGAMREDRQKLPASNLDGPTRPDGIPQHAVCVLDRETRCRLGRSLCRALVCSPLSTACCVTNTTHPPHPWRRIEG